MNTYELAFHLTPNLEEGNIRQIKEDIDKTITSNGGVISFSKEPERIRLSYPIKHQQTAYFGYVHFNAEDKEKLEEIREYVNANPSIMRFLMIKFDPDLQKKEDVVKRMASAERARRAKSVAEDKTAGQKKAAPVEEKVLEEQLEDVIGKL